MPCETQDELTTSTLQICLKNAEILWGNILNIKESIIVIFSIIIFLCFLIHIIARWQHIINNVTQLKINKLKITGKYIEDIFIELNDSKELLRYFLHGKKWRLKIINLYNSLFNFYIGNTIERNICDDVRFSIPFYTNLKNLKKHIEKAKLFFQTFRKTENHTCFKEGTGDLSHYIWSSFYRYDKLLQRIMNKVEMCNTKYVLALGNAGNGKTNLLCSFSETVIKYGQPCVFIEAKEIKGEIEEFLFKRFNIPAFFNYKMNTELFFNIYSFLLLIRRKYLFVVIDALNENDIEGFHEVIKELFDKLSKYGRIKILVSCRSEYFNERFNKVFSEINTQFYIVKINMEKYNERAKEKALINYQKYFNVKGTIVGSAKEKLFASLLLMRIFFEVNRGKDVNTLELRNARIYKQYIKQTSAKCHEINSDIGFDKILDSITQLMLENNSYEGVLIRDLELTNEQLNILKSVLDENLIINKKIKEGTGITERENEVIYFVFDELRDFCISEKILIDCEKQDIIDYKELFEYLYKLNKNKLSPLEGVLKYSYYYLKVDSTNPKRLDFCKKILAEFGNAIEHDFHVRQNNIFSNFSILMILADSTYIEEFEFEHITKSMKGPSDFWSMLNILLSNEFSRCGLTVVIFINILLRYTVDSIRDIITNMTSDDYYHVTSDSNDLGNFCSKILFQDDISNEIKWILIIMNEVKKRNKQIEKCIAKFSIGKKEKNDFIMWLSANKYPDFHIKEVSELISLRGVLL